ncbi:MAG: leucine--tRNA ligase [Candidatus Woesearchaeota archaeon]|jgi:leucyl-tRNA synthetase
MTFDTIVVEQKWQNKWEEAKIFDADVQKGKKKFFCTFPYPYINAFPHIGHLYTIMRVEALARYKKLQGYNVLFPQGWHATGSPIIAAAKRVKEREPKQVKIMADMGIGENELPAFEDPAHWITYFAPEFKKDFKQMGLAIDWRRNFYTTSLNPYYNTFIEWQFRKLKEKKYVLKGEFPVVWCPKCKNAVSDHSRSKGEGETTQEFVLVKHKLNTDYLVSATLRIETILGTTNLWVNPTIMYVRAKVNNETWIISKEAAEKLAEQHRIVTILNTIPGKELIGKKVEEFNGKQILILPATFCAADKGMGVVHSVPSDSPDDWIALRDLQEDYKRCEEYGLNYNEIEDIRAIPVLNTPDYGDMPAMKLCEEFEITSQKDEKKLIEARKVLYKKSFYQSTMNGLYRKFYGKKLEGIKVTEAKEIIKKEMLTQGFELFYELTGPVVCRCLTSSVPKIVSDQWFIAYGDEEWKLQSHKCLNQMKLYPDTVRQQFEYVIDWLHNWACTRKEGLGTPLPWDSEWLIESLSDSTIYMAYYTIAHLIKEISVEKIDDEFFDYVFLSKGNSVELAKKYNISETNLKRMHEEFNYWYPLDFRNSGKDLIQNHLTFFIFNHVALFPSEKWPTSIGINGWVTVDGEKMSKSLGNMIPLRDMSKKFSVDAARFTILSGGDGLDDPNWDSMFATAFKQKIQSLYEFCINSYNQGRDTHTPIDAWMESQLYEIIEKTTSAMEETHFRTATQLIFFELQNALKWYLKRCHGVPNKKLINLIIETQLILLTPFTPHVCEEIWEKIGKKKFISDAQWPNIDQTKIKPELDIQEEVIRTVLTDITHVLKLIQKKPTTITLFVSLPWKYILFEKLKIMMKDTKNPKIIMQQLISDKEFKQYGNDIVKFIPKLVTSGKITIPLKSDEEELHVLHNAKSFLEKEFQCTIEIIKAANAGHQKALQATPGKPAILVE